MTEFERQTLHARSMALHDIGIALSIFATICGLVGMALWPFLIVGAISLGLSYAIGILAIRVSPYKKGSI